jgi:hypothetical protein
VAFFSERLQQQKRKYKPKKGGKNINFRASDDFTQQGLLESRKTEWEKWKQFNAAEPVTGAQLQELLGQGHKPLPLQWIETDKNDHKRRAGGPYVAPSFKSRLVSRGDLEDATGVRTDSPTCDLEGQNLLLSWAA